MENVTLRLRLDILYIYSERNELNRERITGGQEFVR